MSKVITTDKDMTQGSQEWLLWRKKGIGSSDIAAIMGLSPYKTPYVLWLEKTGQKQEEDLSTNFAVQRGVALESAARDEFNRIKGSTYEPMLFMNSDQEYLRFSCDGYDKEGNTFIEIKCPGEANHKLAIEGKLPEHYMLQVQYGLMVSEASMAYYVSYYPGHESELAVVSIKPDIKTITKIITTAALFWDNVLKLTPPTLTNKDLVKIEDPELASRIHRYKELKRNLDVLSADLEIEEEAIKEYAKQKSISYGICNGLTLQKIIKKGNIDYAKIPEIKGIDLDLYRKEATQYYKLSIKE